MLVHKRDIKKYALPLTRKRNADSESFSFEEVGGPSGLFFTLLLTLCGRCILWVECIIYGVSYVRTLRRGTNNLAQQYTHMNS